MCILDFDKFRKFKARITHSKPTMQGVAGILDPVTCKVDRVVDAHIVSHSRNCCCFVFHTSSMYSVGAQFLPNFLYFSCSSRNWTKRSWCVWLTDEQDSIGCRIFCGGFISQAFNQRTDCGSVGRDGEVGKAFAVLFFTAVDSGSMNRQESKRTSGAPPNARGMCGMRLYLGNRYWVVSISHRK